MFYFYVIMSLLLYFKLDMFKSFTNDKQKSSFSIQYRSMRQSKFIHVYRLVACIMYLIVLFIYYLYFFTIFIKIVHLRQLLTLDADLYSVVSTPFR